MATPSENAPKRGRSRVFASKIAAASQGEKKDYIKKHEVRWRLSDHITFLGSASIVGKKSRGKRDRRQQMPPELRQTIREFCGGDLVSENTLVEIIEMLKNSEYIDIAMQLDSNNRTALLLIAKNAVEALQKGKLGPIATSAPVSIVETEPGGLEAAVRACQARSLPTLSARS